MPRHRAASSRRTIRRVGDSTVAVDAAVALAAAGSFGSHCEPLEELQQHDFAEGATFDATASPAALLTRAIKNSGGWTSFSAAHCSFSTSLWQQHLSQQYSAEEQPQEQASQGNRPVFSETGA
ncbi:hypothetical protein [Rosistilla oblonga]|uniref:hypothetical protein n=1 Tax=Rosistilla oblonga TaxID=2527990 RepID=UPI0018D25D64|nr:hypothetical protein [Rosistilla oblonga]